MEAIEKELSKIFKKADPEKALLSFLKNKYSFYGRYMAIVDRKSNIMVRLNSLIITGSIILINTWNEIIYLETVALTILAATSVLSLVFATLAARPTSSRQNPLVNPSISHQLFDPRVLHDLSFDQYSKGFQEMMNSKQLIVANMARELFWASKVLMRKHGHIRMSYNIFLVGTMATALLMISVHYFL